VLDVKTGSGAFMTTLDQARELAHAWSRWPRGRSAHHGADHRHGSSAGPHGGNTLEVREAITYLKGSHRDPRLHELVLALGSEMLLLGGLAAETKQARNRLQAALDDGRAAERCAAMVRALASAELLDNPTGFCRRRR